MRCEKCGGEINLSAGRCIRCGEYIDDSSSTHILHGLDKLIEEYDVGREDEPDEDVPDLLRQGTFKRERKPQQQAVVARPEPPSPGPALGLEHYMRLMGERPEGEDDDQPTVPEDETPPAQPEDEPQGDPIGASVFKRAYMRLDALFAPVTERILGAFHKRFPELKRAQRNTVGERIIVAAGCIVSVALVVWLCVVIASSIAPGVRGEWLIRETGDGERLTWEFTATGKVYVRTYVGDEDYVYQTGSYKRQRKNDHNMLTITYDDGKVTRLYYDIDRGLGVFTNVDSNQTARYKRIG